MWCGTGVSADFRVEGCLDPGDPATQPGHHLGDNVILADAQTIADHLQRQMAVAEVPSDPQQARAVVGLDLQDRLGRRPDPDVAAALEFEPVAVGKMLSARQIEQEGGTRITNEPDTSAMPVEIR